MAEVQKEQLKSPQDILNGIYESVQKTVDKSTSDRQKADPAKELIKLKDDEKKGPFEAPRKTWGMNFDLGKYYVADDKDKPKISENAVYFLTGSVDKTTFNKKTKRENIVVMTGKDPAGKDVPIKWYEDAKSSAEYFLKYADRIDFDGFKTLDTPAGKTKMLAIMKAMSEMNDYSDAAWNKMIKDNKFTDAEIFGPEGAYNLLLAFDRAAGNIDLDTDAKVVIGKDANGGNIEVSAYYKIKLQLAKKAGMRVKDRFGKIIELKVKEEEKKEPVKPPVTPDPLKDDPEAKKKAEEEAKKKAEEEAKKKAEEEAKKKAEEEAKKKAEEEAEAKRKAEEAAKKKPAEDAEKALKEAITAMKKAGFEIVIEPNVNGTGYAKFQDHRLDFSVTKDGKVNFQILTLPAGQPGGEKKVNSTVEDMQKAVLAVKDIFDPVKVMYNDVENANYVVNGARAKVAIGSELTGTNPNNGLPYPKNTHEVIITGAKLEVGMAPNVKIEDMPETTFRITFKPTKQFEAVFGKHKVPPANTPAELIENVLRVKYAEMQKAPKAP